jgi:hypothetical protein
MRKVYLIIAFITLYICSPAQKLEAIYFNLYTDSLKKGFYNYINVDGKYSDGSWAPLDSSQIKLTSNAGSFIGNDIYIDSTYRADTITVKAVLKTNPAIWKEVTIYIRKRGFDEPLKSNKDFLDDMRNNQRKKKKG